MSFKSSRFANLDRFEGVDNMDPMLRAQQYGFNGRIFISPDEAVAPYELFKNSNKPQQTDTSIISNIVVPNALSRTYFSNDNIERLQLQIIDSVYNSCQKKISRQSYQELQIIMKSIYLQYGRNLPYDIEGQVATLNKYVVDECARIIVPNVLQYNKYMDDITSPIPVMPLAQNVSNRGYKWGDFSSLIPSTVSSGNTPQ
jgi:hypothetical protein